MRISDWSSDVCSSDLLHVVQHDTREVLAEHGQHQRHHRQRKRPPEPAREVAKFRIVIVLQARHFRLQRHAAERTVTRTLLPDFRVHRRSEEHTSELQSLMRISYAVFCLKKKKRNKTNTQK